MASGSSPTRTARAFRLWSRNGRDWSVEFAAITAAVIALPFYRIVLDGEAVAHCPKGLPDIQVSAIVDIAGAQRAGEKLQRRIELLEEEAGD
jgi:hypothetical protein